jgi:hypothetical protein
MFDEDELCTKVVELEEIYNFIVHNFLFKIIFLPKYTSQDFIEFIPKESMLYSHKWVCSLGKGNYVSDGELCFSFSRLKSFISQKVL